MANKTTSIRVFAIANGSAQHGAEGPPLCERDLSPDGRECARMRGLMMHQLLVTMGRSINMVLVDGTQASAETSAIICRQLERILSHDVNVSEDAVAVPELFIPQDSGVTGKRLRGAFDRHFVHPLVHPFGHQDDGANVLMQAKPTVDQISEDWMRSVGDKAWTAAKTALMQTPTKIALIVCGDLALRLMLLASSCREYEQNAVVNGDVLPCDGFEVMLARNGLRCEVDSIERLPSVHV